MAPAIAAVRRYLDEGAGFDEYRAAVLTASPPERATAVGRAIDAAASPARTRQARRHAAAKRRAAHDAALAAMRTERGRPHGHAPPRLRADP